MTTWTNYPIRNRDQQDGFERHVWGRLQYLPDAGAIVTVRGTDTQDEEAPVLNIGYGVNFSSNFNTEVMLVSLGSDTGQKYAIVTIPRDKQRQWREGTGGVQHPSDPERALEFNSTRTHLTDGNFAVGESGVLEVRGDTVYIRGKLVVEETATVNQRVITPDVDPGTAPIPGFEA